MKPLDSDKARESLPTLPGVPQAPAWMSPAGSGAGASGN
jgi:hypothetical protein